MSNVLAAIGRGQIRVLEDRIRARRSNFQHYLKRLGDIPGIYFLPEPKEFFSNRWLTTIIVDPEKTGGVSREDIRQALEKENIESRPVWKPMHMQPVFAHARFYESRVSEALFEKGLCLPSGSALTEEDLERVVTVVRGQ